MGCAHAPPRDADNACSIFAEKRAWYRSARKSFDRWGVPPHVQLAIVKQESAFTYDARPPRTRLLFIIPWTRPSSAFGFAQVKDETWDWYREKSGNSWADRDEFGDAVDFIGWYGSVSYDKLKISKWDAYNQYLAYHEGHGGFARKTYEGKPWLMKVARKVEANAKRYRAQLGACKDDLDRSFFWFF
jgi:hypothetical protein